MIIVPATKKKTVSVLNVSKGKSWISSGSLCLRGRNWKLLFLFLNQNRC